MGRSLSLTLVLAGLWVLLSGHLTALLLCLGLASSAWVVRIAVRMEVVDHEGHPFHLNPLRVLGYWAWLTKQIVLSNIDVARRILDPRLPISPCVVTLRSSQRTRLAQVIYANSITLTPGTVSINVAGEEIRVHALTREGAEALARGEMDARVSALEVPR